MRRALLRLLLWSVAGGLPPRRPDQVEVSSSAGVAPGASSGITRARLVIISGPSSGMFLYSGLPAHGDLVESVTEATSDPYTNPTHPGFGSYDNVFGNSAQLHAAVLSLFNALGLVAQLSSAGLQVFNSHGALIYSIDTSRDATFLYADTGSAAQGALLTSSASAAGTDSFGNAFDANAATYVNDPSTTNRWAIDLGVIATGFAGAQHPGIGLQNKSLPFFAAPNMVGVGSGIGSAELALNSGAATSAAVQSLIALEDSLAGIAGGTIAMQSGVLDVILTPGGAATAKVNVSLPDGNTYRAERLSLPMTGTLPQTINSTTPAVLQGLSCQVGAAGTYRIRANLICTQGGAASAQNFRFQGTAALAGSGPNRVNADFLASGGAVGFASVTNFGAGFLASPAFGAGASFHVNIEGHYSFGTAGTFALAAAEGVATSFSVVDGSLDVEPQ